MGELKLFVVGSSSNNPTAWNNYGSVALVLASTPDEAIDLADDCGNIVTELHIDKPVVLMKKETVGEY
jgi:hypothetical protein